MRVAAGLLILVICSAWGFRRSLLLKRRCTLLRELRLLVEQYSIEISLHRSHACGACREQRRGIRAASVRVLRFGD